MKGKKKADGPITSQWDKKTGQDLITSMNRNLHYHKHKVHGVAGHIEKPKVKDWRTEK
jgi:hypothetical protein